MKWTFSVERKTRMWTRILLTLICVWMNKGEKEWERERKKNEELNQKHYTSEKNGIEKKLHVR